MVLVQSVLSSIPVYWMGLAPLPVSILHKLRSITFAFLWGSSGNTHKYHLVSWSDLSWPKKYEGWGIKNLHWFNIALRLKTFWRVLFSDNLWHRVLISKYLRQPTVTSWLREKKFNTRGVSAIWRGFIQTLPWMGSHLTWQVGNGNDILIGTDHVIGNHDSFHFPEDLRTYLEDLGIIILTQSHNSLLDA